MRSNEGEDQTKPIQNTNVDKITACKDLNHPKKKHQRKNSVWNKGVCVCKSLTLGLILYPTHCDCFPTDAELRSSKSS